MDVARRQKTRIPGGEWTKVQSALIAMYGQSKRTPSVLFARARLHTGTVGRRAWCVCGAHAVRVRTGTAGGPCAAPALRAGDPVDPRTFAYRMVIAASTLPDSVLVELERLEVPNSYIHENPYFVGQGATISPGPQLLHGSGPAPVSPYRGGPRPRGEHWSPYNSYCSGSATWHF